MNFQEPMVRFVRIDMQFVTATSSCEGTGHDFSCDDVLLADFDVCNCWPSGSGKVTQIDNKMMNASKNSSSSGEQLFNDFVSFDK